MFLYFSNSDSLVIKGKKIACLLLCCLIGLTLNFYFLFFNSAHIDHEHFDNSAPVIIQIKVLVKILYMVKGQQTFCGLHGNTFVSFFLRNQSLLIFFLSLMIYLSNQSAVAMLKASITISRAAPV